MPCVREGVFLVPPPQPKKRETATARELEPIQRVTQVLDPISRCHVGNPPTCVPLEMEVEGPKGFLSSETFLSLACHVCLRPVLLVQKETNRKPTLAPIPVLRLAHFLSSPFLLCLVRGSGPCVGGSFGPSLGSQVGSVLWAGLTGQT